MAKKFRAYAALIIFGAGLFGLLFFLSVPPLPADGECKFYDRKLKVLFCRALKEAEKSIDMITFGLTDRDVLRILEKKAEIVHAIADKRSTPKHPLIERRKKSGLTHAKVTLIDGELVLIGSANTTTSSLEMHRNFVMASRSKPLCAFLKRACFDEELQGRYKIEGLEVWLTPDKRTPQRIIELIDGAKSRVQVIMFTLTHPEILDALQRAKGRGVRVELICDRYCKRPDIEHKKGVGGALIHHKWAVIDESTLICGSANWTKGAFARNRDILLIMKNLDAGKQRFCQRLWKSIDVE